jgi:hypothetical protein
MSTSAFILIGEKFALHSTVVVLTIIFFSLVGFDSFLASLRIIFLSL